MKARRGYILVETITAMAILSITAVTAQRAIQVAIQARGLAQDYTTAQLLLEDLVADQTLQPRITLESGDADSFPPPHERFQYAWRFETVELPFPELPPEASIEQAGQAQGAFLGHMGRLHVVIAWSRAGQPFEITAETLVGPDKAWRPPEAGAP